MRYNPSAHKDRRTAIHVVIAFLVIIILLGSFSCTSPRNGCHATRGMAGYSYCPTLKELRENKQYPYLFCHATGKVIVMDMQGNICCSYYYIDK